MTTQDLVPMFLGAFFGSFIGNCLLFLVIVRPGLCRTRVTVSQEEVK